MDSLDGFHFEETFGALLIGAFIAMTVYGITTLQAYFYYMSFPKDGKSTKMLVASIWILDTLHTILMCHSVHFYLINGFTNPSLLINGNWSLFLSIAINIILAFVVQVFFTQRIFILCSDQKRYWVAGVIGIFVFAHFVFGLNTVVHLFITRRFVLLKELSLTSVLPFGATTILSDILIAVALCILLSSNRSSFQDTNTIINKLIIYAVNRCILTCAVAIVETIVFSTSPNSFYTFSLDFVIGKLYANSLLAVLNARATLRSDTEQGLSSTELSTAFNFTSVTNHRTSLIQVRSRESFRNHVTTDFEKGESSNFGTAKRIMRSSADSGDQP